MKIGIVYAMESEIKSILDICGKYEKAVHCGVHFYITGNIVLCTAGVGKVNAALGTTLLCELYKPDVVINAGIAGSFKHFGHETLLVADKCMQYDVDTTAVGDPRFFVSTVEKISFETDFVDEVCTFAREQGVPYEVGLIASGDLFMTDGEYSREINRLLSPLACEMEGCAVAQVCYRFGIRFIVIKTASDCIFADGAEQSESYHVNLADAAQNLNNFVYKLALFLTDKK